MQFVEIIDNQREWTVNKNGSY